MTATTAPRRTSVSVASALARRWTATTARVAPTMSVRRMGRVTTSRWTALPATTAIPAPLVTSAWMMSARRLVIRNATTAIPAPTIRVTRTPAVPTARARKTVPSAMMVMLARRRRSARMALASGRRLIVTTGNRARSIPATRTRAVTISSTTR